MSRQADPDQLLRHSFSIVNNCFRLLPEDDSVRSAWLRRLGGMLFNDLGTDKAPATERVFLPEDFERASHWLSGKPVEKTGEGPAERHYRVEEVAKLWNINRDTVRKLFRKEPGVLKIGHAEGRYRRSYFVMRIPESVLQRVYRKLRVP
jgi:hypothetical protein